MAAWDREAMRGPDPSTLSSTLSESGLEKGCMEIFIVPLYVQVALSTGFVCVDFDGKPGDKAMYSYRNCMNRPSVAIWFTMYVSSRNVSSCIDCFPIDPMQQFISWTGHKGQYKEKVAIIIDVKQSQGDKILSWVSNIPNDDNAMNTDRARNNNTNSQPRLDRGAMMAWEMRMQ